eukprot:487462_1
MNADDAAVQLLMSMGFDLEQIKYALKISDNNIELATHILLMKQAVENDNDKLPHEQHTCNSISSCNSIKNIGQLLAKYAQCKSSIPDSSNYQHVNILNDYHHVLMKHRNKETEDIMDFIKTQYDLNCNDLQKCLSLRRSYRDRGNVNLYNQLYPNEIHNDVPFVQLIDNIHNCVFHSFDLNHSIKKEQMKNIYVAHEEKHNNTTDNYNQKLNINSLKKTLKINRNRIKNIIGDRRDQYAKFATSFKTQSWNCSKCTYKNSAVNDRCQMCNNPSNNINKTSLNSSKLKPLQTVTNELRIDQEKTHTNDENKLQQCEDTINAYSFGYPFTYWEYYKNNKWYIAPKYVNIREEIFEQKHQTISKESYNNQIYKAQQFLNSVEIKKMKAKYYDSTRAECAVYGQEINIVEGSKLREEHVLSLIFYTSFDALSYGFSCSCRKLNNKETDDEIKQRHRKYFHFAKYLYEAVNFYGFDVNHEQFGDENGYVYHGINQPMLFQSMMAHIKGPFSTTSNMIIAFTSFAGNDGIVLALRNIAPGIENFDRFFLCNLISDFAEEERLFFQTALRIVNIYDARANIEVDYGYYCHGIAILNQIIKGDAITNEDIVSRVPVQFMSTLVKEQCSSDPKYSYANSLIKHVFEKHRDIYINLWTFNFHKKEVNNQKQHGGAFDLSFYGYLKYAKVFMESNSNCIALEKFMKLFKNVKTIYLYNQDFSMLTRDVKKKILSMLNLTLLSSLISYLSSSIMSNNSSFKS